MSGKRKPAPAATQETQMTTSELPLVAIDDGYAQIKIFGDNPDGGEMIKSTFRTSVRPGRYGLNSLNGEASDAYRADEGEEFTISDLVGGENTQFDSFHVSPMNRVLVHHGLAIAGYAGTSVDLITGLPVADYFNRDERNDRQIEAKRTNLLKGVTRLGSDKPLATVANVSVGCQAVAAWVDYALDDDLQMRIDPRRGVAIVDIGGRTTDIAVVMGGTRIDHAQSGTQNVGVIDIYNGLSEAIRSKFEIRDNIPHADLDRAVREKVIHLWGADQDVSDLVTKAVAEVSNKIDREIERKLGSAATLAAVVFVGGGGALLKDIPARMRNGVLADDPEFANARGLWKFARLERRKQEAA